jgi:hypothetical protein
MMSASSIVTDGQVASFRYGGGNLPAATGSAIRAAAEVSLFGLL